jgi:hypothetical protein
MGGSLSEAMRSRAKGDLAAFQFSSVLSFLIAKIRFVLTGKLIIEAEAVSAVLSRRSSKYTSWRSDGAGRLESGSRINRKWQILLDFTADISRDAA